MMKNIAPAPEVTIYTAREIITMNPSQPRAEAVAVVGDRIAAVGSLADLETLAGTQPYTVNEVFSDKVLIAGFVEPHFHPWLAALTLATDAVISIDDWDTPTGFSRSVRDQESYRARLAEAINDFAPQSGETFLTWGYHHYFHGELSRSMLDEMAPDFPVIVWHRSAHELYLNSKAMEEHGIDEAFRATFSEYELDQSDFDRGHFFELGAIKLLEKVGAILAAPERLGAGLEFSETYGLRTGITVAAEPGAFYDRRLQSAVNAVYGDDATPFRQYFIPDGKTISAVHLDSGVETLLSETRKTLEWGEGQARFLPQQVKMFTDGAVFSQLMQMRDGYTDGHDGEWLMYPDRFTRTFQAYWDAGYTIHVHNNGDGGMDVLIANLEQALRRNPRFDHRTNVHHFGFAASDQIERLRELGAVVSANPYYVTALATRYAEIGIGSPRAENMVPLGDAERAGLSISLHSDMPMGPADPLLLVWAAVNRITAEGETAGPEQRTTLETALKAVTINAAYAVRLEHEIGSIEPGKLANFTVLEESPFDVAPEALKDIGVWGTVLEGRIQAAPGESERASVPVDETDSPVMRGPREAAMRQPERRRRLSIADSQFRLAVSRVHAEFCSHQTIAMRQALSDRLHIEIAKQDRVRTSIRQN